MSLKNTGAALPALLSRGWAEKSSWEWGQGWGSKRRDRQENPLCLERSHLQQLGMLFRKVCALQLPLPLY